MMTDKWKGHAAVLAANIIFGLNIPITKALLDRWIKHLQEILYNLFYRSYLARQRAVSEHSVQEPYWRKLKQGLKEEGENVQTRQHV